MKYAFLIYLDEQALNRRDEAETAEVLQDCFAQFGALRASGRGLMAERLLPVETATTLRVRGEHEVLLSDGPFAETKEQLAGVYIIHCASEAEAIATAKDLDRVHRHPAGCIEVRPVLEIPMPSPAEPSEGRTS